MSTAVRRGIYGRMAGDTTLNALLGTPATGYSKSIYHQEAPSNAGYPFVIFQKSSGVAIEAMGDAEALKEDVWLIKGIDRSTTADPVEAVQLRLEALLNDAPISVSGGTVLYLRHQSDVEYPETTDGVQYKHAGGLYRLVLD